MYMYLVKARHFNQIYSSVTALFFPATANKPRQTADSERMINVSTKSVNVGAYILTLPVLEVFCWQITVSLAILLVISFRGRNATATSFSGEDVRRQEEGEKREACNGFSDKIDS